MMHLMTRAGRLHGVRALVAALGLCAIVLLGLGISHRVFEANQQAVAEEKVDQLFRVRIAQVPDVVKSMEKYRRWVDPLLRQVVEGSSSLDRSPNRLHASLALFPVDGGQFGYLYVRLLEADADEMPVLRDALKSHQAALTTMLWPVLESSRPGDVRLLPAASALALYDPQNARWADVAGKTAEALVQVNADSLPPWRDALKPVKDKLADPLATIFRDKSRTGTAHSQATNILTDYARDNPKLIASVPELVANVLMDSADPKTYAALVSVAQRQEENTLPLFRAEIRKEATHLWNNPTLDPASPEVGEQEAKDRLAQRCARAAIALMRMGKAEEVWPLLRHSPDPRLRSFIINWLNPLGADPRIIAAEFVRRESPDLAVEAARRSPSPEAIADPGRPSVPRRAGSGGPRPIGVTPVARSEELAKPGPDSLPARNSQPTTQKMDTILVHPEISIRRALILALGTFGPYALSPSEREPLIVRLLDLYKNDADSGIHGAAEWTLRQWNEQAKLKAADTELPSLKDRRDRRWFINSQGQTFALIEGPVEFRMGSPLTEPDRDPDETPHQRLIPRRFAIAAMEVTVEQYQKFVSEKPQFGVDQNYMEYKSREPDCPMIGMTWFGAVAYCNWLSKQEGLPTDQWCYQPNEWGEYGEEMTIPADVLKRTGYRLPTEAEWEYACRAGAMTARYYGLSVVLLEAYARFKANSGGHPWPGGSLLPNDLGLFDMLGNVSEWCEDLITFTRHWGTVLGQIWKT